ncbi:MAG: D-alanine--D-alanine ligase [Thermoleophilia bacterium]
MNDLILKKSRIGVLMGGFSREREVSLRSGEGCLGALKSMGYDAVGIDVGHDVAEVLVREGVKAAFLALHGKYGEDGCIQGLLEMMGIPYTGSRVLASAIGMNKVRSKQIAVFHKVPTAAFEIFDGGVDLGTVAKQAVRDLRFPVMIKPCEEGSSLGVVKVNEPAELIDAVVESHRDYGCSMVEEFIEGDEITIGLLETRRQLIAMPVLQLKPSSEFYDFKAKYNHGMTEFVVPAEIPEEVATMAQEMAMQMHTSIGCRGYSRVDFIVDRDGIPHFTEINTLPGMTETSDFPAQAKAGNITYEKLVEKMLRSALLP